MQEKIRKSKAMGRKIGGVENKGIKLKKTVEGRDNEEVRKWLIKPKRRE